MTKPKDDGIYGDGDLLKTLIDGKKTLGVPKDKPLFTFMDLTIQALNKPKPAKLQSWYLPDLKEFLTGFDDFVENYGPFDHHHYAMKAYITEYFGDFNWLYERIEHLVELLEVDRTK